MPDSDMSSKTLDLVENIDQTENTFIGLKVNKSFM